MRFQIVLAAFLGIAVQMISSKKGFGRKVPATQKVNIDNTACASGNSFALNCGVIGDANSLAVGDATNANCVDQNMKTGRCDDDIWCD
jgi:hypothetical protein